MSAPVYDAVIAGGGLSGLSLAARLAAGGWRDRAVLVVDDPGARPAAAGWGYWSAAPGLLDSAVSHTYRRVRVHADGQSRLLSLGGYRYHLVRRADLHRAVLERMAGCPRFALRRGRVQAVADGPDAAEVVVDGQVVRARWVFDGVTPPDPPGPPDARLAFTGWWLRCPGAVFDPGAVTLLDFRTPQADGARFMYVCPTDPHSALVEVTEFVPRHACPPTPAERQAALAGYLEHVVRAGDYTVTAAESAVLPLRVRRPARRAGRRVLRIGAPAGLVKASTGYAFQRVQWDSEAIVASLSHHGHPFDLPAPRWRHRWLDRVLLDVLDRDPAQLRHAFARLFRADPAETVLRFLDERSTIPDELSLIATLPVAPYLRAAAARPWHAMTGSLRAAVGPPHPATGAAGRRPAGDGAAWRTPAGDGTAGDGTAGDGTAGDGPAGPPPGRTLGAGADHPG